MKRLITLLLLALVCTGCSTVKVSSEGGETSVDVEIACWKIFWVLPIASGDPEIPNDDFCCWFRNTATVENNMKLLDYAMRRKNASGVKNVTTRIDERKYLWILKRYACQTSAVLVK